MLGLWLGLGDGVFFDGWFQWGWLCLSLGGCGVGLIEVGGWEGDG